MYSIILDVKVYSSAVEIGTFRFWVRPLGLLDPRPGDPQVDAPRFESDQDCVKGGDTVRLTITAPPRPIKGSFGFQLEAMQLGHGDGWKSEWSVPMTHLGVVANSATP